LETGGVEWSAALAGLGMFLFGMSQIESAIKTVLGIHFKTLLKKATGTTPKSIATGIVAAGVLQSSTLVSLMSAAFVSAGMMSLLSGVGTIIGANFGSVGTSWIVTLLGFKFSVSAFAKPMIGIAGVGLLVSGSQRKVTAIFTLMMGFGLLFFGLDLLKESMEKLADSVDIARYHNYGLLAYVAIGFFLTAILNSSAASMAIFLAAVGAKVVSFEIATAMVIGANIGTTITIVILAIFGSSESRRIASAHVAFNIGTAIIIFALIKPINIFIQSGLNLDSDPVLALTIFHTIFNATGLIIFGFFTKQLTAFLAKRFVRMEDGITRYLNIGGNEIAEVGVEAIKKEAGYLMEESMSFCLQMCNIPPQEVYARKRKITAVIYSRTSVIEIDVKTRYEKLKKIEVAILEFSTKIGDRTPEEDLAISRALAAAREATYAAKVLKDTKNDLDEFAVSDDDYMLDHYNQTRLRISKLCDYLHRIMQPYSSKDEATLLTKLNMILNEIAEEDKNTLQTMSDAIKNGDIAQSTSPTFISMNRAVVNAGKSLVECVQLLYLSEKTEREEEISELKNKEISEKKIA
jgi:phosphate:Na+ symporter